MLQRKNRTQSDLHEWHCPSFSSCAFYEISSFLAVTALEGCWMTSRQLEAARVAVTRHMKREGQIWLRLFPDKPITNKPAEVRMGKGKGAPEYWVAVCKPGAIIFEAEGVSMETAKEALRLAAQKLPVVTKFVVRRDYIAE